MGADAIELDVHASADDVAIVIHDASLDRTTDRTGAVRALPAAEITTADAGARFTVNGDFPFSGRDVRVPTLDDVLHELPDTALLIELKSTHAASAVRRAIIAHDAMERCLLMSADDAALAPFREPPWLVGASGSESWALLRYAFRITPRPRVGYKALSIPPRLRRIALPIRRVAAAARRLGVPVHLWTVDDPRQARRYWRRGVAGIITNSPLEIVRERARLGRADRGKTAG